MRAPPRLNAYNADDTVVSITDARSARATYTYNNRHLVTGITYSAPAGITPTSNVSFGYDAAGNRTSMTDGLGSVSYNYDQLSRLTSETRYFGALSNSPTGGNYGISYQYNLANELTSITDPFGAQIGYTRDATGRTTNVTGSGFANVTSYVSNIQYRAWGAVKAASYGNPSYTANRSSTTQYNNRMQPTQFRLRDNTYNLSLISENYAYFADGRLSSLSDLDDTAGTNPPATLRFLTRSFGYDQIGRVIQGYSPNTAPFRQTYGYDEFDNLTSRAGSYYWQPYQSATFTYANNRRNGWSYDANGQISNSPATTTDDAQSFYYDAGGRVSRTVDTATNRTVDYRPSYDGDGNVATEWSQITQNGYPNPATLSYVVRSTVLHGEVLTRLDQNGNKSITYVPAEGLLFATQTLTYGPSVAWSQRNPLGITETGKGIYDPLGNYIPFQQYNDPRPAPGSYNSSSMSGVAASLTANPFGSDTGCIMDGLPTACSRVLRAINNGQGDKVTVIGFSSSVQLSLFMASYSAITTTGNRYRLPPTTTYKDDNGNPYVAYGQPPVASEAAVQFVIIPGFQLGFEPNVNEFRTRIAELVKDPKGKCATFIRDLIKGTATASNPAEFTDAVTGFKMIKSFVYGDTILKAYGFVGGTVHGTISRGTAQVELPYPTVLRSLGGPVNPRAAKEFAAMARITDFWNALHEVLHLAGKNQFDDFAYAVTVADMAGEQRLTYTGMKHADAVRKASDYWNKALLEACKPHGASR